MGDKSKISWTDATWNPVRGCSRVSEGCRNCYAERMAARFCKPGEPYHGFAQITAPRDQLDRVGGRRNGWTRNVAMVQEHLADPLHWRKPRRIFTASMSDVFHEDLTNEQISAMFGVMAACPQHTFQVLTKRAKRMREWFAWLEASVEEAAEEWAGRDCATSIHDARTACILEYLDETATAALAGHFDACHLGITTSETIRWPLANVWIGVSVENQTAADERIPELLATPAAVRFLSCEPLLGEVKLRDEWLLGRFLECPDEDNGDEVDPCAGCPAIANDGTRGGDYCGAVRGPRIHWLIAGCESGSGARQCEVEWLRSLRDQCAAADKPFFLKQARADERGYGMKTGDDGKTIPLPITTGPQSNRKRGDVIELPYLDGKQHAEMPSAPHG